MEEKLDTGGLITLEIHLNFTSIHIKNLLSCTFTIFHNHFVLAVIQDKDLQLGLGLSRLMKTLNQIEGRIRGLEF